jgi:hypothetical protein
MTSRTHRPASFYRYAHLLLFKTLRYFSAKNIVLGSLLCCLTVSFLFGISNYQESVTLADTAAILPTTIQNEVAGYQFYDVCFVSCIYANSKESADKPADVSTLSRANPSFGYFLYTNLVDLDTPGWTKVVKQFTYRRYITQSRWGKFMSWKDPEMQACQTIFYFDGHFEPRTVSADVFRAEADAIRKSKFGLAQIKRGHSIMDEFQMILDLRKDIPANVEAAKKWLQAQPDFNPQCTMYANCFFGKYRLLLPLFVTVHHITVSHRSPFVGLQALILKILTFDKRRNSCGAITRKK